MRKCGKLNILITYFRKKSGNKISNPPFNDGLIFLNCIKILNFNLVKKKTAAAKFHFSETVPGLTFLYFVVFILSLLLDTVFFFLFYLNLWLAYLQSFSRLQEKKRGKIFNLKKKITSINKNNNNNKKQQTPYHIWGIFLKKFYTHYLTLEKNFKKETKNVCRLVLRKTFK